MIQGITYVDGRCFVLQSIDKQDQRISSNKRGYVLLIKANWCGHCISYFPKFEDFAKELSDYQFLVLESTDNPDVLKHWSQLVSPAFVANSFPTVVKYDSEGEPISIIKNRFKLKDELD
jgi:thiol-disulfide isomerase/thioredoxin